MLAGASPIDVLPETLRVRALPPMPWPATWPDLARRCRTYPGDLVSITGDTGSGKTQLAVQLAIAFTGAGRGPVLWSNLELTQSDVNMRICASRSGVHMSEVRDEWSEARMAAVLGAVTDRWRFVDRFRDPAVQIAAMEAYVEMALEIYRAPPLLVVDYAQKLSTGSNDKRAAMSDAAEALREMTARLGCYTIALSQTSRGNRATLAGRVDVASATDTVGAAGESSEIENAASNAITMVVFKTDDAPTLDAHWHVGKARHTGLEGRVGARYTKRGGVWEELDHLPATPIEVEAEVKRTKKAEKPRTQSEARDMLNGTRSTAAADRRREAVVGALRAAGAAGIGARDLRKVKGSGSAARLRETMDELERGGRARCASGRWVLVN